MTRDEALALIPPGWVECDFGAWAHAWPSITVLYKGSDGNALHVYAIPAPKPEPRRVPCGEMVMVEFSNIGYANVTAHRIIRDAIGSHKAVANTKWRIKVIDGLPWWVDVLDEA